MSARPDGVAERSARGLITAVRRGLAARADPAAAPRMQAYVKSAMPYRGVPAPGVRAVCREAFVAPRLTTAAAWRATVLALWRGAEYREERYAAIELCGHRYYRSFQTLAALPMYEELVVTGAWWDYVDAVASHQLGGLLRSYPDAMGRAMRRWARSDDLWKRRSAVICQLSFKQHTDLALLYECIEHAADATEFFLRKAIGWALREYAKTDPAEVERYVRAQGARLSPLSRREALRNLVTERV